jgi:hypothetical protein
VLNTEEATMPQGPKEIRRQWPHQADRKKNDNQKCFKNEKKNFLLFLFFSSLLQGAIKAQDISRINHVEPSPRRIASAEIGSPATTTWHAKRIDFRYFGRRLKKEQIISWLSPTLWICNFPGPSHSPISHRLSPCDFLRNHKWIKSYLVRFTSLLSSSSLPATFDVFKLARLSLFTGVPILFVQGKKINDDDDDDVATSLYKQDIDLQKTMRCACRGHPPIPVVCCTVTTVTRIGEDENSSERRTGTSS